VIGGKEWRAHAKMRELGSRTRSARILFRTVVSWKWIIVHREFNSHRAGSVTDKMHQYARSHAMQIDGQGSKWWKNRKDPRGYLVFLVNSTNIHIEGLTFQVRCVVGHVRCDPAGKSLWPGQWLLPALACQIPRFERSMEAARLERF
jgi:hypothetical protein